jgi:hypothetical protein
MLLVNGKECPSWSARLHLLALVLLRAEAEWQTSSRDANARRGRLLPPVPRLASDTYSLMLAVPGLAVSAPL